MARKTRSRFRTSRPAWSAAAIVAVCGCSGGPAAVAPPDVDRDALCRAVLADFDADGDGSLTEVELEKFPPIRDRFAAYDRDRSGVVSGEELRAQVERIFDGKTGLMGASCRVTRNGQPLVGAYVYFVPPSVLADALPVASGVTSRNGVAQLSIQPADMPASAPPIQGAVRPGMYLVEVTHPQLQVPEHYNKQTTLGREISAEVTIAGPIDVALKF